MLGRPAAAKIEARVRASAGEPVGADPLRGMRVRGMRMADAAAVRCLFRDTIALGRPLPFLCVALHRYEALCLAWYLQPERLPDQAVLADDAGRVHGYALVCT